MVRYIFVTGGVVSSLGKGIAAASLGAMLQSRGYSVCLRKLDPYLNVDPGTMSPFQHGEVFVTDDGAETDLDLGHYERFTGIATSRHDSITTGRIYKNIIEAERRGDYLGATVQVIPHVTDEIKKFIKYNSENYDFIICEIGGTVGDIEAMPFIEAIRQLRNELPAQSSLFLHLTLMPYIKSSGELKTKPTQHSVKELQSFGVSPDVLLVRCDRAIPPEERKKLSLFCNVRRECVIQALDVDSIYRVPLSYHEQGLDDVILKLFNLSDTSTPDLSKWQDIASRFSSLKDEVKVAIVGKYINLKDAYKSLVEALLHGGLANDVKVDIKLISTDDFDVDNLDNLVDCDAILVPGAFGSRGVEEKIEAIKFARINNIPFFGICFGMQLACIEAARNLAGIKSASSSEFGPCDEAVVGLMKEWMSADEVNKLQASSNLGGTMRLGAYKAHLAPGSLIERIYKNSVISERHRHRYEVNKNYCEKLEKYGLVFSAFSPDGLLPEAVEIPDHRWFLAVQYHPELISRPFKPHPLFVDFIAAAKKYKATKINGTIQ